MKEMAIGLSPEGVFKRKLTDKVHNGLRCYEIVGGEITGMSMVTEPANEMKARVLSEEDQTFAAPIILADKMIYRINPITGEEYYIYFTAAVIKILVQSFRKINWTLTELNDLYSMYVDGKTLGEIALHLDRTEEDVSAKLLESEDSYRNATIIRLSNQNKTTTEISIELGITEEDLFKIISQMGGKGVKK